MKKTLLFLLFVAVYSGCFAADKYEAWIIQLNRDTLYGFVSTEKADQLHWQIVFTDSTGQQHPFKPGSIAGFGIKVEGEWQRYAIIDIGEPVINGNNSTLVFAQVINDEGRLKLYRYKFYKQKPGYYRNDVYIKGDLELVTENCLLKHNDQVLRLQEQSGMFTGSKKQLKQFLKDCPQAVAKTERAKDIFTEMPALVQAYNLCKRL
jgi:hypothetical protein